MYEISSDSEEDYYNKFSQKQQKLKSKHTRINKLKSINLINSAVSIDVLEVCSKTRQNTANSDVITVLDEIHEVIDEDAITFTANTSETQLDGVQTRSRRAKRKDAPICLSRHQTSEVVETSKPSRGRGRRGRGAKKGTQDDRSIVSTPSPRNRGRKRSSRTPLQQQIIYSVGNTDEYPDASEHQELFTNKSNKKEPVNQEVTETIDLDESVENEELSVKVYWQHSEVFKFNIRRLQKLTQIFDFFVDKEGVSRDRLLFTYNSTTNSNQILYPNDTPDSINYNIAKFIEGGIVNKKFKLDTDNLIDNPKKKGFSIKFQFQGKKKPLELSIDKDEKLRSGMIKCAETLEVTIAKLSFEFDGEIIQGNLTPNDLEMENGDCIDVKIING